jgi:hypothetical protein
MHWILPGTRILPDLTGVCAPRDACSPQGTSTPCRDRPSRRMRPPVRDEPAPGTGEGGGRDGLASVLASNYG